MEPAERWQDHYLERKLSFMFCTNMSPPPAVVFSIADIEDARARRQVDVRHLFLGEVESGEWTRSGWERRWTFTGRIAGEDVRSRSMSEVAVRSLEAIVAWKERPMTPTDGSARMKDIRAAVEAIAPGSTHDHENNQEAFAVLHPVKRIVFVVSAQLTEDAQRMRDEDLRRGTRLVPHDESPEETAKRLLA